MSGLLKKKAPKAQAGTKIKEFGKKVVKSQVDIAKNLPGSMVKGAKSAVDLHKKAFEKGKELYKKADSTPVGRAALDLAVPGRISGRAVSAVAKKIRKEQKGGTFNNTPAKRPIKAQTGTVVSPDPLSKRPAGIPTTTDKRASSTNTMTGARGPHTMPGSSKRTRSSSR